MVEVILDILCESPLYSRIGTKSGDGGQAALPTLKVSVSMRTKRALM